MGFRWGDRVLIFKMILIVIWWAGVGFASGIETLKPTDATHAIEWSSYGPVVSTKAGCYTIAQPSNYRIK